MKQFILLFILIHISISLQAQVITGQVYDARTKEPLPFVSISIKNTTKGILSKENGSFSISINNRDTELIFSSIGYFPKVIKASKVSVIYWMKKKINSRV
jgi:hypothetical protein